MDSVQGSELGSPRFSVAGIGASAGGITALQSLFKSLPDVPDLAFVVVQHLHPDQNQLVRLFEKWTRMPLCEAKDGMTIEPGSVYLAPPGKALGLEQGAFTTRPLGGEGARAGIATIDLFFESLAANFGARSIAVVLSGSGADGAAGAVRVKQAGGLVFVQDPTSAMHDSMPKAVIANGTADRVLSLGAIAQELVACAAPAYDRSAPGAGRAEDVGEALGSIVQLIRDKAGFDLTGYKTTPLLWRIQRRMERRRVPLFRDYEALLHDDPTELESLLRGMPIHVTDFFRDANLWELLRRKVVPTLFDEQGDGPVRAWTPACSTGQEAYSLAMLFAEQADLLGKPQNFQLFATDASPGIVARAGRGIFKAPALSALSAERQQRFFYTADGAFRVKRALREKMVFAPQDLLADPPFSSIDLITCRNLLIYLEPDAAKRVIELLHAALRTGGYLFLGTGESLSPKQQGFDEIAPNSRIYRKNGLSFVSDLRFPKRPQRLNTSRSLHSTLEALSHEAALEERGLPAVIVDDHFQIVRVYGDTGPFVRFRPGEPSLDFLELVEPSLGIHLKLAAEEALAQRRAMVLNDLADPTTGDATLNVRITPLQTPNASDSRLLVSFIRASSATDGLDGGDPDSSERAHSAEIANFSEALRISHEELEASREELQALNEELRASNDQLNLANEELNQANEQLREKVGALETQSNVLSSGAVVTLFLDAELRMRWFTPGVCELFPLKKGDLDRPITDLRPNFDFPEFIEHVRAVMRSGEPREAEVRTFEGRWFLKRIRPFQPGHGSATAPGVAITFTDITDRKRVDQALRASEAALASELQAMNRLHAFSTAAIDAHTVEQILEPALDTLLRLHGTDLGSIQLYDPACALLRMAAQRGFEAWFVEQFAEINAAPSSPYARAMTSRERVNFEDIASEIDDESCREAARRAGYRAMQATPLVTATGGPLGMISTYFRHARRLSDAEYRATDILANELSSALERFSAGQSLRENTRALQRTQGWLSAQKEAFQSAMNGAPLEISLGILARSALALSDNQARCAFYVADASGKRLRHVVGMSESYARAVDGFQISPESLACGLAIAAGQPVITPDVLAEPRWQPWTWLAREYDYRACWSFPVETSTGALVASFAMYFAEPREPTPQDSELVAHLLHTAAIIISRHPEARNVAAARPGAQLAIVSSK